MCGASRGFWFGLDFNGVVIAAAQYGDHINNQSEEQARQAITIAESISLNVPSDRSERISEMMASFWSGTPVYSGFKTPTTGSKSPS